MRTIFETCIPRDDVLTGELRDEMFAARLKDVVDGVGVPVYNDAKLFFENTYPTEGLRTLVREVLGRLSGGSPANSPVIRLETSFGGGKTHNLIALFHLAQGHHEGLPKDLVPAAWIPSKPWPTVGIVGSDLDPANGIDHGSIRTRTLWGELAWQAGGALGFELVRSSDEEGSAPGTGWLDKLVGQGPALIMLDEVARYLRVAKAVATANKRSDLAEQTVAFLMSLIEFAASKQQVAVVMTLADSSDAFGQETEALKVELEEAHRISARQERVITPTGETEISAIVAHRLFASIDREGAKNAAQAFASFYGEMANRDVELPGRAVRPEYAAEIVQDYPFHPELLTVLNRKTSTIPNFQKTRGALRILARVVRGLWDKQPPGTVVITSYHLDLADEDTVNDLTSRLQRPQFRQVVEADISSPKKGSEAHCQTIDRRFVEAGKPPYATRTATTILLHSLTQGIATGVEPADLYLATLQPGDDPQHLRKALALMLAEEKGDPGSACWYLHYDGFRYRFKTEPSLEKVIQDEMGQVGRVKAKEELDRRITNLWKKGALRPVLFPAEAADLDDDATEPKLVIIHYHAATTSATDPAPPELVSKLFSHAGSAEGYRTYKNNVVFLVADHDYVDRMTDLAQRYLAIGRILGDADRLGEFNEEQRKKLKGMHGTAELDVRVAITRAYRHLFYPSSDAPKASGGVACEVLPAQDQGEVEKDQSTVLLRALGQLDKLLRAEDPAMPAAFVKAKAWPVGQESITTEDLRREFAKRIGLKIVLDVNQLKKTIKNGISQGTWVYFDAAEQMGYGLPSPAPLVQLSEDAILYTPAEAQRLALKIKGTERRPTECPLCGNDPCTCGDKPEPPSKRLQVKAEGAPGQVFQEISDRFHDQGAAPIACLRIRCEGAGKQAAADARSLGLAIPQLGRASYHVEQTMNAQLGEGPTADTLKLTFAGGWERYKRVKQLTDSLGQEATQVSVRTTLRIDFADGIPADGERLATIKDVFTTLGFGKLHVEAEEAEPPKEPS